MSKLVLPPGLGLSLPSLELPCTSEAAAQSTPQVFHVTTPADEIHHTQHTSVYRVDIDVTGEHPRKISAILKTDILSSPRPDKFRHEASMYTELKRLQGHSIPTCFGLFQVSWDGRDVSVLVLEDCGDSIEADIDDLTDEFKAKAMSYAYRLHWLGFEHGDLELRNILNKNGEPFLIDFEHAKPHKCGVKLRVIMGEQNPGEIAFGCRELHRLSSQLLLWARCYVQYDGFNFSRNSISWDNMDGLLRRMEFYIRSDADRERMRNALKPLVAQVEEEREWCGNIDEARRYISMKQMHFEDFDDI
ncbi:hypothetical protein HGRIS_001864 [Hohenbuehelia grisea]|uniref:Protein kinase domain-containing protein n=1 Tax=Hohenbuehelia grisea TaxID=104357 RepID=A0ABR3JKG6_9AGAR